MKKGLIISLDSISRACTRGRGNDKKRHAFFRVDAIEFATNSAKFLRRSVFDIRSIRIYSSFIFPPSWREEDSHTLVQEEFITWREF